MLNCPKCGREIPESVVLRKWHAKNGTPMEDKIHPIGCENCARSVTPPAVVHYVSTSERAWTKCGFRVGSVRATTKDFKEVTCKDCLRKVSYEQEGNSNAAA